MTHDPTDDRRIVRDAATAFADELPWGKRKLELRALVATLKAPTTNPIADPASWTTSFADGLRGDFSLQSWMNEAVRESQVRSRRSRAWIYPVVILSLVVVLMSFIVPFIVRPFELMFDEFGLTLPVPTLLLFQIANTYFPSPWTTLLWATLFTGFSFGISRWILRYQLTRQCNWVVAGNSSRVSAMSSFTGMLAHLLDAKVPLPDAIAEAARTCGNAIIATDGLKLANQIRDVEQPLASCAAPAWLPLNVWIAIAAMQNDSSNTGLLRDLAAMYEERLTTRTNWTANTGGLFGIVIVGVLVASMVIALFMPLIELISGLA